MKQSAEHNLIPVSKRGNDKSRCVSQVFVRVFEDRITDVHETRVLFVVPSANGFLINYSN